MKIEREQEPRVCQGDIIRDVEYFEYAIEENGILEVGKISFPLAIVLTQDCDLQQDYTFRTETKETQDKWLISVLLAPLYNYEHLYAGEHLSDLGIKSQVVGRKQRDDYLTKNQLPRYHYLEFIVIYLLYHV